MVGREREWNSFADWYAFSQSDLQCMESVHVNVICLKSEEYFPYLLGSGVKICVG